MLESRDAAFEALASTTIDASTKGFPPRSPPLRLDAIGRQGWRLTNGDLPFPVAVLSRRALATNSAWMRTFIEANRLRLAPHGKTTMAPQLFRLQQQDGAWAITVASAQQFAVCRQFGFTRLLIANELVGAAELRYVLDELARSPELEAFCLIDSKEGVARIAEAGRGTAGRLQLLLEVGIKKGRAGCRDRETALAVARKAAGAGLSLRGVEGFEGILSKPADVDAFLAFLQDVAKLCAAESLFVPDAPVILSAGGSVFYDRVAAGLMTLDLGRPFEIVVRSGCYLTHDSLVIEEAYRSLRARAAEVALPEGDPEPALTVWAQVLSRPEPDRAILGMGRRDVGFDAGLPLPLKWCAAGAAPADIPAGYATTALNDQHCYLQCPPSSPLAVGDLVGFGISHPCTTFDKWQLLHVVDDDLKVVDAVRTFF